MSFADDIAKAGAQIPDDPDGGQPGAPYDKAWQGNDWLGKLLSEGEREAEKVRHASDPVPISRIWEIEDYLRKLAAEHKSDQEATAQRRLELGAKIAVLQDQVDTLEQDMEIRDRRLAEVRQDLDAWKLAVMVVGCLMAAGMALVVGVARGMI